MTFRFDLFPVIAADDNPRANGKVFQLLKAVRETGSLHRAAREIGLSYRHAWGVMRAWEEMLGRSMLDMERGRGADAFRRAPAARRAAAARVARAGGAEGDGGVHCRARRRPAAAVVRAFHRQP